MPVYPNNLVEKTGKTKARMIRFCLISYFNNKLFRAEINTVFGGVFVLFCSFTKHVFYLSHRCGPCLRIAPAFSSMSNKYPQAVFLEVDVHQCQGTAATNNISATPTFLFFRNKVRIDQYQGADAVGLEEKIKQHLENDPGSNEDTDIPKGYMDLMPFINKAGCECLNESDEHGFDNCLRKDMTFLESDCDEQLLITVAFNQPVKLYSMKFQGPDNGQGPKYVKIFINLPRSMDFEEAERSEPTQALELTEDDIKEDGIVPLRYVKFQNVNSVTMGGGV
uniref:Thioredoxin like 1 n=1 Tax=Canis lupus familiaris TaxID=9615 RepID=A0A8C0MHF0_CANLF